MCSGWPTNWSRLLGIFGPPMYVSKKRHHSVAPRKSSSRSLLRLSCRRHGRFPFCSESTTDSPDIGVSSRIVLLVRCQRTVAMATHKCYNAIGNLHTEISSLNPVEVWLLVVGGWWSWTVHPLGSKCKRGIYTEQIQCCRSQWKGDIRNLWKRHQYSMLVRFVWVPSWALF